MATPIEVGAAWFAVAVVLFFAVGFYAGMDVAVVCLLLVGLALFVYGLVGKISTSPKATTKLVRGVVTGGVVIAVILGMLVTPVVGVSMLAAAFLGFSVGFIFCKKGLW